MNILFTCAGRRNYLANYFRDALPGVRIVGADMVAHAPALQECDIGYIVPAVAAPDYLDALAQVCRAEKIDLLISLNDYELPILARGKATIEATGARVLVSSPEVVELCFDKLRCAEWLKKQGMDTPFTLTDLSDVHAALDSGKLSLPLVVKPRWGSASAATFSVHTRDELDHAYALVTADVLRNNHPIPSAVTVAADEQVIVQARLSGVEHGVDVLNDFNGKPQSIYVKEKISMRSGETDRACLRDKPAVASIAEKVGKALGHIGNMDCDIFLDESTGAISVLELNPRFGGGYPFSQSAGADFPAAILAWMVGDTFDVAVFERCHDVIFAKADRLIDTSAGAGTPIVEWQGLVELS